MSLGFKKILKKFLIWRFQYISDKQFINISSAVIGLLAAFVEFGELPLLNELIGLILILSGIFIMLILASRSASK